MTMDFPDDALTFKVADQSWEFEQIHQLNYRTFVEEIPQHAANDRRALVDRFHDENTYLIALRGRELVGMVALRCTRPFSLDQKLPDLDQYLPTGWTKAAEIRLLATDPSVRGSRLFFRLLGVGTEFMARGGFDLALISGTTRQLKLYHHLGFVPFGPLIGTPGAMYQPMYLTRGRYEETARSLRLSFSPPSPPRSSSAAVNFLPGPVDVSDEVRKAFDRPPVSHRAAEFLADFQETRAALRRLTGAAHVQVMTGSGTLANDVVAAQLSLDPARGLILSNGEFGDRLIDHARRMSLAFSTLRLPWGGAFDPADVDAALAAQPSTGWLWAVHCETSTGALNDLLGLKAVCARRGVRLYLDCISSLGTVPVDLTGVHLASGVSGKGFRGFPGLCLVFHDHTVESAPHRLPRYLDLGLYAEKIGIPFTICSNLLYALKAAVEQVAPAERFARIAEQGRRVRRRLVRAGFEIVAPAHLASPAVIALALPPGSSAEKIGDALAAEGFLVSYRSHYLLERNWLQVCLMGEYDGVTLDAMLDRLCAVASPRGLTTPPARRTTAPCPPIGSPSSGSSTWPSPSPMSIAPSVSTGTSSA
jgi:aspartate aminotransferase-like enzyme